MCAGGGGWDTVAARDGFEHWIAANRNEQLELRGPAFWGQTGATTMSSPVLIVLKSGKKSLKERAERKHHLLFNSFFYQMLFFVEFLFLPAHTVPGKSKCDLPRKNCQTKAFGRLGTSRVSILWTKSDGTFRQEVRHGWVKTNLQRKTEKRWQKNTKKH